MKQRRRIYHSASQRAVIRGRWRKGETIHQIAGRFDRSHSSIQRILAEAGGIRPAERRRSKSALTLAEREEISRGIVAGRPIRSIAASIGRAPSTISRELRRNGGAGGYRASSADQAAGDHAHRPKGCKRVQNRALALVVAGKLRLEWSPEQIAGWLRHTCPDNESYQVSHETIYRSLFLQTRGALKKELMAHSRRTRGMRRSRHHTQKTGTHGRIVDAVPIGARPAGAEDRAVSGHWEGDLLFGRKNSQIATLMERQSRYLMLAKVDGKDTETVVSALIRHAHKLPRELYKSLTWDRGEEMADHQRFTLATDAKIYFCDPQSPWQRGSNENTNGWVRQYLPKGIDLSTYSKPKFNAIARRLNERPRKTRDFETTAQRIHGFVASTGWIRNPELTLTLVHKRSLKNIGAAVASELDRWSGANSQSGLRGRGARRDQPQVPPSTSALISGSGGSSPSQIARNALAKSSPSTIPFTAPFTSTWRRADVASGRVSPHLWRGLSAESDPSPPVSLACA